MDMNSITELLKEINIAQLVAIGVMIWFFYSRLDGKIEKQGNRLDEKIEKQGDRLDEKIEKLGDDIKELRKDIQDIDKRLCRLEGAFSSKECCMIKDERKLPRAE